jgi:hypothetical protein
MPRVDNQGLQRVSAIDISLASKRNRFDPSICVLDVYGAACFAQNGFFCNETRSAIFVSFAAKHYRLGK